MIGEEAGKAAGKRLMGRDDACSSSPGWVLAATQTGRPESRPESWARARASAGGGLASNLRLPATADPRRAEPRRAARRRPGSGRGRARSARASARATCGSARPAPEGALRHAPVDEDERNAAPLELEDGVRPDLGFGDEREVRPPVVEEAAHVARRVERHELVHGAGRQAAGDELGRGPGAGGDEDVQAAPDQALDHRHERERLADARPVQPGEARHAGARRPAMPRRSPRRSRSSLPRRMRHTRSAAAAGSSATRPPR